MTASFIAQLIGGVIGLFLVVVLFKWGLTALYRIARFILGGPGY